MDAFRDPDSALSRRGERRRSPVCDDSLISLVTKLRLRYEELESLDLTLNPDDAAELRILGQIISFLEEATQPQTSKH